MEKEREAKYCNGAQNRNCNNNTRRKRSGVVGLSFSLRYNYPRIEEFVSRSRALAPLCPGPYGATKRTRPWVSISRKNSGLLYKMCYCAKASF
jgi:hypothetical protein